MIKYGKLTTPEGTETEIVCTFKNDNFTIESMYSMDGNELTNENSFHEGILFEPQGSIEYPDDTIGSADFRDPSPNDVEECRGNYEAELMALPGSNRRAALDGYRNSNSE